MVSTRVLEVNYGDCESRAVPKVEGLKVEIVVGGDQMWEIGEVPTILKRSWKNIKMPWQCDLELYMVLMFFTYFRTFSLQMTSLAP